jgi:hypothetical protein
LFLLQPVSTPINPPAALIAKESVNEPGNSSKPVSFIYTL